MDLVAAAGPNKEATEERVAEIGSRKQPCKPVTQHAVVPDLVVRSRQHLDADAVSLEHHVLDRGSEALIEVDAESTPGNGAISDPNPGQNRFRENAEFEEPLAAEAADRVAAEVEHDVVACYPDAVAYASAEEVGDVAVDQIVNQSVATG